ncbi:HD domain-containing protein [Streptomyces sp. NPDC004111]|uniref:HD domain-containing protein n=1 Tax=Streptomyces sp. NPDC004111 TaxID=3364690 RepID=UPI00368EA62F
MDVDVATAVAESLLAEPLPRRWAHSQGVAAAARTLREVMGAEAPALEAAAVLHDIGYSPAIAVTGFHPLDGARHLRELGAADDLVVCLVANHSFALMEAEERGLYAELAAEFPLPDRPELVEALVYCDMTTTPQGQPTTTVDRLAEITQRYGPDSVVGRFIARATPGIRRAVGNVESRLGMWP